MIFFFFSSQCLLKTWLPYVYGLGPANTRKFCFFNCADIIKLSNNCSVNTVIINVKLFVSVYLIPVQQEK